ncbi:MAG: TerC family protein [Chitinophagales bacterium]|nr:TerC family protein [Chitinophagales bacterium]
MFETLASSEGWISLVTLIFMEIILGVDNIIFISIIANRLQENERARGRLLGLGMAMIIRLLLLFGIAFIISLTKPWFTLFDIEISGHNLIMLAGGLFLLFHTTREIHTKIEGEDENPELIKGSKFGKVIIQIALINLVFSVDSILTALGMTDDIGVMMLAIVLSMIFMIAFAGRVSDFINRHPTMKMLALSFLLMIAILLIADGLHYHIDKRFIYFSMAFSFFVEFLNMRMRKKRQAPEAPL